MNPKVILLVLITFILSFAQIDLQAPPSQSTYNITGETSSNLFASDTTDLKLLNRPLGKSVFLSGLTIGSSIGAGYFTVVDSTFPDGGEAFDHLEAGKQWVRVSYLQNRIINVKDFGAVGDGVTDDRYKLTDAFSYGSKRKVEFDGSTYYLGGAATIESNTEIIGNGSKILHRYFKLDSLTKNVTIKNLMFDGQLSSSWIYGIRLNYGGMGTIKIKDCTFKGNAILTQDFQSGMSQSDSIIIENCTFDDSSSTQLSNVSPIQLHGFNYVEIKNCKFNSINFSQAIKLDNQVKEVVVKDNEFNGSYNEEILDVYSVVGPVTFEHNHINTSGGGIIRSKQSGTAGDWGYPYKITVKNNIINYTGSTSNLIYLAGSYSLSFDDSEEQQFDVIGNKIKVDSANSVIRVIGVDIANINDNQIYSAKKTAGYSIYIATDKYLNMSGNNISGGGIIGYPASDPHGNNYASTFDGSWNIHGNIITANGNNEAPIYIYNQNCNSISITDNTLNLWATTLGYGVRVRYCQLDLLRIKDNILDPTNGGYKQYARVNLKDTNARVVDLDNYGNNVINVKDFGAVGDGVIDDTQAIQDALDYAAQSSEVTSSGAYSSPVKVYAEGTYKVTGKITISVDVDMKNATFVYPSSFADTAIVVKAKTDNAYLRLNDTYLPTVKIESKVDNWTNASTGIKLISLIDSKVHFGEVWYFQTGIFMTTHTSKALSYNEFYLNSIRNNKVGLLIYPATSGWTNENNFYGGRIRIDSGFSDYTGTVLLHIAGNNNNFYKLSLEGNYDETKIWLDANSYGYGCAYNTFYSLRPEKGNGKWKLIADGSGCLRNSIVNGYIANFSDEVDYVSQNSATDEALTVNIARENIKIGSSNIGVFQIQNKTSNSYPAIGLFSTGDDPKAGASPTSKISATGFEFKASNTYTNPYLKADPSLKGLIIGRANLDPSSAPYLKTDYLDGEWQLTEDRGSFRIQNHAWNGNCLILGSYYIWVDGTGDLRIKNGKPTSDTDGTIVGTQN